jgi:hypothetical protein
MALFTHWMVFRDVATLLRLLETAEYFDPASYNPVFEGELEKLIHRLGQSKAAQSASEMRGFDWGNYIARSLLRGGFRDDDQQEAFQHVVFNLLVSPGKLFRGYDPSRHGPLDRRLKQSVWNALRNISEKSRNRRKRVALTDPTVLADTMPGRQPYSDLIDQFRQMVGQHLGSLAVQILDQRLRGEDTKELVTNGTASAFYVKREVGEIKKLAERFAARLGDPAFARMVAGAMEAEAETVAKRKSALAARQAPESL